MSSKPVALLLADLGVTKSHSRPHTSNDNPLSEAQFKTLKYRPDFPKRFESIEAARVHCDRFFGWYNHEHKHSGIGLHTPADVHYGRADQIRRHRATVLDTAYRDHLERIRSQTTRATRATGLQRDQPTTEGGPADSINPRKSCLRNVDRFRPGLLDLPAPAPVDLRRLLPSGQIR